MLVHRDVLKALLSISDKERSRYRLDGIHLVRTEGSQCKAEGTNGKMAVAVRWSEGIGEGDAVEPAEYPAPFNIGPEPGFKAVLDRSGIQNMLRTVKGSKQEWVGIQEKENGDRRVRAVHADQNGRNEFELPVAEGTFPDVDDVFAMYQDAEFSICLDADLLLATVKAVADSSRAKGKGDVRAVRLDFFKPDDPVRIVGETKHRKVSVKALLMPINFDSFDE